MPKKSLRVFKGVQIKHTHTYLQTHLNFFAAKKNQHFNLTPDTGHLTCDTWWGVNIISKCQLSSSQGLGAMMFLRFGGKDHLINRIVCRTAPDAQSLLKLSCHGN